MENVRVRQTAVPITKPYHLEQRLGRLIILDVGLKAEILTRRSKPSHLINKESFHRLTVLSQENLFTYVFH